ncbi:MAG TPA: hypothetical protein VHK65_14275 [Candidatus Dormibacteraeota bacterium]|nr:hypothetical protein [Candidatus Dormibacteraeota bacterium]
MAHSKKGIADHEVEFEQFKRSLSLDRVLATAKAPLTESLPPSFREAPLARLTPVHLFESDLELIFTYKLAFEAIAKLRPTFAG